MVEVICIERFKDKSGKIIAYKLYDKKKTNKIVTSDSLKSNMREKKINVTNLKLTNDDKIMIVKGLPTSHISDKIVSGLDDISGYGGTKANKAKTPAAFTVSKYYDMMCFMLTDERINGKSSVTEIRQCIKSVYEGDERLAAALKNKTFLTALEKFSEDVIAGNIRFANKTTQSALIARLMLQDYEQLPETLMKYYSKTLAESLVPEIQRKLYTLGEDRIVEIFKNTFDDMDDDMDTIDAMQYINAYCYMKISEYILTGDMKIE